MGLTCSQPVMYRETREQRRTNDAIIENALNHEHLDIELLNEALIVASNRANLSTIKELCSHPIADAKFVCSALDHMLGGFSIGQVNDTLYGICRTHSGRTCEKVNMFLRKCVSYAFESANREVLEYLLCDIPESWHNYLREAPFPEHYYVDPFITELAKLPKSPFFIKSAVLCAAIERENLEDINAILENYRPNEDNTHYTTVVDRGGVHVYKSPQVMLWKTFMLWKTCAEEGNGHYREVLERLEEIDFPKANKRCIYMMRVLIDAIQNDYSDVVQYLICCFGYDIIERDAYRADYTDMNAIECAIYTNKFDSVRILLYHISPSYIAPRNGTPVRFAIEHEKNDMLRFLLEKCRANANFTEKKWIEWSEGRLVTPFIIAADSRNYGAMEIIAELGGDPAIIIEGKSAFWANEIDLKDLEKVKLLFEKSKLIPTATDVEYLTKLAAWGALNNQPELALTLVRKRYIEPGKISKTINALLVYPTTIEFNLSNDEVKRVKGDVSDADAAREHPGLSRDALPKARLHCFVKRKKEDETLNLVIFEAGREAFEKWADEVAPIIESSVSAKDPSGGRWVRLVGGEAPATGQELWVARAAGSASGMAAGESLSP